MSSNLVIVAIPNEDDYVWKISSEKVPHMTILFLGEAVGNPRVTQIASFLQHAADISLMRFGMDVDRRGTLGADQADVLFFNKKWAKDLNDFRFQLLQDPNIKTAYDSVEQFDEWNPHLTLGYPETPAHEDTRDYPGIHWVNFDKVALWFGDYQGLEFPLKSYDWDMEVSMGAVGTGKTSVEDTLAHFGVKGMKWGVRNDTPRARASSDAAAAEKARKKLKEKGLHTLSNDELRTLSKRIEMEKKIKDIDSPIAKVEKGHKAVKGILGVVATVNAILLLTQTPLGKAIITKKSPQGTLF